MNILEEIQSCSVEWKELGEVVDYEQPTKYIVSSKAYVESNEIPVLTAGQSFILGYTNEKDGIYQASKNNPVIIFDDFTTSKQWVDFKFKVKSSAMKMLTIKDEFENEVLLRYVWHYLGTITYKPDQHGRQWIGTYSKFLIPIPPLEIQEKIVQILDKFTDYVTELTSELTLRKKQYSYYRDTLLSFEDEVYQVEWKTLGEVAENLDNMRKPVAKGGRSLGIYPYYGASGIVDYVDSFIFDGDYLLISEDGANLVVRKTPIAFSISGKTWVNNHAHVLKFDNIINQKFVNYYLNYLDLSPYITGAAQPKLNQQNLNNIKIPYPSLEIQSRIVQVLDNFDKVCNDLNIGLPKEIELRQKQYEYFREKLLTFVAEGEYTESRVEEWNNSAIIKLLQWVFGPIRVELGAMAKIVRGASPRPISKFITESEKGIPWIKIGDVEKDSKYVSKTKERITQAGSEKSRLVYKGDFIMSNSMSFGRPYILDIDGCIHDGWLSISSFEDLCSPDYLYHYLLTDTMQHMMRKNASNGTVQNLNADIVRQLIIILPPLSIQSQIVSILDKLDTLTNSLSEGLPKEIEQRQKQYGYWREQLFNFDL